MLSLNSVEVFQIPPKKNRVKRVSEIFLAKAIGLLIAYRYTGIITKVPRSREKWFLADKTYMHTISQVVKLNCQVVNLCTAKKLWVMSGQLFSVIQGAKRQDGLCSTQDRIYILSLKKILQRKRRTTNMNSIITPQKSNYRNFWRVGGICLMLHFE